jgi:hypothetical protein
LGTKRRIIALLAGLVAIVATGCGSGTTSTTVIRVSPEEFFTGELKRLGPHLELSAAGVKLDPKGPPMKLHIMLEEYNNGKPRQRSGSESGNNDLPNEITVSLKPATDANAKQRRYRLVVVQQFEQHHTDWALGFIPLRTTSTGQQSVATDVGVPVLSGSPMRAIGTLTQPDELTPDHPVRIWGCFEGRGAGTMSSGETIAQTAARVEWALVLKLELR